MKPLNFHMRGFAWLFLILGVMAFVLAGCGTVEGDSKNASTRPWNTPKSWEGGFPTSINEGR